MSTHQKLDKQRIINKFGKGGNYLYRVYTEKEYSNIVQDLAAYTGLDELDLLAKVLLKPDDVGHFVREFNFYKPKTKEQINWFYRVAQGYLFGNMNRTFWEKLKFVDVSNTPILDYGGGIGNNTIPFADKEFMVDYFDVSIVQRDFVKFRGHVRRNHCYNLKIFDGFYSGEFSYLDFVKSLCDEYYGLIILQDVLEHIPHYEFLLKHLCPKLRKGGMIVEYSPFRTEKLNSVVHLPEVYLLETAMAENGMVRANQELVCKLYSLKKPEEAALHKGIWIRQ